MELFDIFALIIYIVVAFIVFFIFRGLWLWYLRINDIVSLLDGILFALKPQFDDAKKRELRLTESLFVLTKEVASIRALMEGREASSAVSKPHQEDITQEKCGKSAPVPLMATSQGFRSIAWDTAINDTGLRLTEISSWNIKNIWYKEFINPAEELLWNNIKPLQIRYGFIDGKIHWGFIEFGKTNTSQVFTLLTESFGLPTKGENNTSYWSSKEYSIVYNDLYSYEGTNLVLLFMSPHAYIYDSSVLTEKYFRK